MDIRDFNYWLTFKEKCKYNKDEKCGLKENGLCVYVLCPLIKLDRDVDFLSLSVNIKNGRLEEDRNLKSLTYESLEPKLEK